MTLHRLTLRVGLPFVLLVLLVAVGLAFLLDYQAHRSDAQRMVRVAVRTASLIENTSLETSPSLAKNLESTNGYHVFFRATGLGKPGAAAESIQPPPPSKVRSLVDLEHVPADSEPREVHGYQVVAVPIPAKNNDLLLVREVGTPWLDVPILAAIGAILLVGLLTAGLVGRGLVRPLRNLTRQLPRLDRAEPLDLPEAARPDEIGDLARAFLRTQQALHDEKQARERAEKLAVLGRMTAALAHEVQNPVAAIRMHAQLLRVPGVDDPDGPARTIENEATRIECLLNQWLFLTRPEPPAMADLDVGALLARVVGMHRAQAAHADVELQLEAQPGLNALGDGRRLEQVFRNLLANALQAMPGGGRLAIRARRHGEMLEVSFADTGAGFSPTALQRFGEFFYSEREGGMGIGLSVATGILHAHGGRLRVANAAGGGAVVTVELRASTRTPVRAAVPTPAP